SGMGWIPYGLERMDLEFEDQDHDLPLKLKTSEYWHRQSKTTFQDARGSTRLIEQIEAAAMQRDSDNQHTDSMSMSLSKYIHERFKQLPDDITRKMTCETAGKFYGLIS